MMPFNLSVEAEEDIISIAEQGICTFGSAAAQGYHDQLFAVFDLLASNPRMASKREEISTCQDISFQSHLVVYRIEDSGSIFVVRIRHGHEDWARDFF